MHIFYKKKNKSKEKNKKFDKNSMKQEFMDFLEMKIEELEKEAELLKKVSDNYLKYYNWYARSVF